MKARGVALVMALLVVALASSLAAHLIWRENLWISQVEAQRDLAQARQLAFAGLQWACAVLADDATETAFDHPQEAWARPIPPMAAEGGMVSGRLHDEQVRWNLNNLRTGDGKVVELELAVYRRLLQRLGLAAGLADTLADWMDADADVRAGGAEEAVYLARRPSMRARGGPLLTLEELQVVSGYSNDIVERLRPHVTALPGTTRVNINGASVDLLEALAPAASHREALHVAAAAAEAPFRDIAEMRQRLGADILKDADVRLTTQSRYFSLRLQADFGRGSTELITLIERGRAWPLVLWQRFG